MIPRGLSSSAVLAAVLLLESAGCTREHGHDHSDATGDTEAAPTNRIELPADSVANLGVTFARARRGRLEEVLSVPGFLAAPETHRFEFRAPAAGVVRAIAPAYSRVAKGEVVAHLVTEELGRIQGLLLGESARLIEAETAVESARADVDPLRQLADAEREAADGAEQRVERAREIRDRAVQFEASAGRRLLRLRGLGEETAVPAAELVAAERDALEARVAVLDAEQRLTSAAVEQRERRLDAARAGVAAARASAVVSAREATRASARASLDRGVDLLAELSGRSREALIADAGDGSGPSFATLTVLPLAAPGDGVVARVHATDGAWLEAGRPILEIVDPSRLRFEGSVPESQLELVRRATAVRVRAASGTELEATLLGPASVADRATLSVPVRASVVNHDAGLPSGVSATAELVVSTAEFEEVLLPEAAIVVDGLESIVFRRDPGDPSTVIRSPVSTGRASGGWIEVFSGVGDEDEVVLDGVRQLKQIGLGAAGAGTGHFHADGTWHKEDE